MKTHLSNAWNDECFECPYFQAHWGKYDRTLKFYENRKSVITTHIIMTLFKGDPAVRESEGSLFRTGYDQ